MSLALCYEKSCRKYQTSNAIREGFWCSHCRIVKGGMCAAYSPIIKCEIDTTGKEAGTENDCSY